MWSPRDFDYDLPAKAIAHVPAVPRDSSKLLILERQTSTVSHHVFRELPELLQAGDVLVRNNTKVIPARLFGRKKTGGEVELLLTKKLSTSAEHEDWECMTKPGLKPGQVIEFDLSELTAECTEITGFTRTLRFNQSHARLFESLLQIGQTPLPPYIEWQGDDPAELRKLYQTTFAKIDGSAAAPTAGLHFTPEVDARLMQAGVIILEVTLHVGLGTFMRVKVDDIKDHDMHSEWFELSPAVATALNQAKKNGQRIISVGTTTTRVLESCFDRAKKQFVAQSGETKIFIYPPYEFQAIDGLITNFHEPESTLTMLVSALVSAPNTPYTFTSFATSSVGLAYQIAIVEGYRLLSFGDAMLIL